MTYRFFELPEAEMLRIINEIAERTPRDRDATGLDWSGEIDGVPCRGYKSPDGKVLRYMWGDEGPFQSLNERAAMFGYSIGDAVPEWARELV